MFTPKILSMFISTLKVLFGPSRNISIGAIICLELIMIKSLNCFTEEYVRSHITKDTRWNAEDSPYILEKDLVIDKGVSLTISPGVQILIRKPKIYDTTFQYDGIDSQLVSIKVKGALSCIGKPDRKINFIINNPQSNSYGWYGIVFDHSPDNFSEIAFSEISNAYRGVSVKESSPIIRNTILEYNHIGIYCSRYGNARVYNCVITRNLVSGIHIREANPQIANNIIVFNDNNGVLCDGKAKIDFKYNCVYGNRDGNFLDCYPELGVIVKSPKSSSLLMDYEHNIYMNPIFAGSVADSIAEEQDLSLPTSKSKIKDTVLSNVYYAEKHPIQSERPDQKLTKTAKYTLSAYSPCNNNGLPNSEFKNVNGSRNTMGIWGGPENLVTNSKSVAKPAKSKPKKEKEKSKKEH